MIIKLIAGPLIGMIIGYFTNWLAVRMLFRPREAKYIAGHRLPFTPGVIPRGKQRLASAVAGVIDTQLLTEETIKEHFTSDEMQEMIKKAVRDLGEQLHSDDRTIQEYLRSIFEQDRLDPTVEKLQDLFAQKLTSRLKNGNISAVIAKLLESKISDMTANSFLGKILGDSMLSGISSSVEKTIDEYIDAYGEQIIKHIIKKETERLFEKKVSDAASELTDFDSEIEDHILHAYTRIVSEKSGQIIRMMNVGGIAEKAILDMNNEQLEQLVLSTMKTELNSVVRLGALIGFLLGLINMLVYLL